MPEKAKTILFIFKLFKIDQNIHKMVKTGYKWLKMVKNV